MEAGHEVVGCFAEVAEALPAALALRPDLVLTNIVLGTGESGIIAATRLLEAGLPSIFVSGSREDAEAAKGAALGILEKPCRAEQIADSIEAIGEVLAGGEPTYVPNGLTIFAEGITAFRGKLASSEPKPAWSSLP